MERSSGILMHISSLPSPYGIGTLGREAYAFVDFLAEAGQRYWQLLPLGPTGVFDSPYQSFSTYAGNPYFIDLDLLRDEGLLEENDYCTLDFGTDADRADFGKLYRNRYPVLRRAYARYRERDGWEEALSALMQREPWLPDYALFMALKSHFGGLAWTHWPDEAIRTRRPEALVRYRALLREEIGFHAFVQGCFFWQWEALRAYVAKRGVRLIGDLPIYVPLDSADVWTEPAQFQLDETLAPVAVAGVPPDSFSATGQLWGNPLYDWDAMESDGFSWWIDRVRAAGRLYDVVRIDHFRGLASYWSVPADASTAECGEWRKGPGMKLVGTLQREVGDVRLIAEDLGFLTEDVIRLREEAGLPGMKIVQFAFDSREKSDYLPHNYKRNCICYTGTHDNTTARGWFSDASPADVEKAVAYLGLNAEEGYGYGLIRGGMSSVAELFIATIQDYLDQDGSARMNTPGTVGNGNWCYRVAPGLLTDALASRIHRMTELYGR